MVLKYIRANLFSSQAFYQDVELSSYEIDNGITEIGEFAFARSGLTSVTIPEGVTKIGYLSIKITARPDTILDSPNRVLLFMVSEREILSKRGLYSSKYSYRHNGIRLLGKDAGDASPPMFSCSSGGTAGNSPSFCPDSSGIQNLLADNAQKGKDFPKYTVIDGMKIASHNRRRNNHIS